MAKSKGLDVSTPRDWETEEDLRVLTRAAEIKKDPKRMARVKELAKKRLEEIASVAGAVDAA